MGNGVSQHPEWAYQVHGDQLVDHGIVDLADPTERNDPGSIDHSVE